ncbi:hypothetical protein [Streptomyces sp. NPDC048436]|uniref:hypothetical protein n=1 Tax=Streptomyces sp. NPDC048436 TaxID=3365550 RepID=UPI003715EC9D
MVFPDTALGVRVELHLGGAWLDITGDVYTENPITITCGRPDEGARTDAASCTFVLNNTSGRYSPRNPRSDLYGLLGRNTPVRVSVAPYGPTGPRLVRFVGEVPGWPVKWGTKHSVSVSVTAAGILRRLGQGAAPLQSAMRREFSNPARTAVVAYWPLEDGSGATEFASALPGAAPMRITSAGIKPAAYTGHEASDVLPTLGDGAATGITPIYPTTGESALRFFAAFPDSAPEAEVVLCSFVTTGRISRWSLTLRPDGRLSMYGRNALGVDLVSLITGGNSLLGKKVNIGLDLIESGFLTDYRLYYVDLDAYTYEGGPVSEWSGNTIGQAVGRITHIGVGGGKAGEAAVGHVVLANAAAAYSGTGRAMIGWAGESLSTRLQRIAAEEKIPFTYTGRPNAAGTRLGAQTVAALLDLFQVAADADSGMLHEQRDALALAYRSRATLYTQPPALTLDYAAREVVAPLEPVDDDQAVRNDVTVQRTGGSSARAVCESGPLSVLPPPDGIGRYTDSRTLNLYSDDQCAPYAWWGLHRGTWDEARYPSVSVALHEAPHLAETVAAVDVGDRARILTPPPWLPPGTIELLVEGYTETLGVRTWEITFTCSPGGPWLVATLDDVEYAVVGTDGTELVAAIGEAETTFEATVTAGPAWPVAALPLNTNPDMSEGLDQWTGYGGTLARVPTPDRGAGMGAWSAQFTPDGIEEYPNLGSDLLPVTAARSYTVSGWLRSASARTVDLDVNWFDATGEYLDTAASSQAVTAGAWTWFEEAFTAPVGAAFANIAATIPDFPPAADVLIATRLTLRPTLNGEAPGAFPIALRIGGEELEVHGIAPSTIAGLQTFTVTRGASGLALPHLAGAAVQFACPAPAAL